MGTFVASLNGRSYQESSLCVLSCLQVMGRASTHTHKHKVQFCVGYCTGVAEGLSCIFLLITSFSVKCNSTTALSNILHFTISFSSFRLFLFNCLVYKISANNAHHNFPEAKMLGCLVQPINYYIVVRDMTESDEEKCLKCRYIF